MNKAKIGLVGIVPQGKDSDVWSTMRRVAETGYQGIEGGGFLRHGDVAANVRRLHDLGLTVLTTGASREQLRDELPEVIANAHALEAPRVTVWWSPCETRESLLAEADLYNSAGAQLAAEGIKLCYHNHEHEFLLRYNGVYALDVLAEHTDPVCLSFELDIAWIAFGREDPPAVIRRMAGRVAALHVKDLYGLDTRGQFTAVGTGVVKVRESIVAAIETGVEWVVVEQDELRNLTPFETITVSYLNLKEMGLV